MAIKCELTSDKERGPGYGILKIDGFGAADGPIDLSIMRNQGTTPFLGLGQQWQATESWHGVQDVDMVGSSLLIPVGPDVVDPIVNLPTTVAYRLTVAAGTTKQTGVIKVDRPFSGRRRRLPVSATHLLHPLLPSRSPSLNRNPSLNPKSSPSPRRNRNPSVRRRHQRNHGTGCRSRSRSRFLRY